MGTGGRGAANALRLSYPSIPYPLITVPSAPPVVARGRFTGASHGTKALVLLPTYGPRTQVDRWAAGILIERL